MYGRTPRPRLAAGDMLGLLLILFWVLLFTLSEPEGEPVDYQDGTSQYDAMP